MLSNTQIFLTRMMIHIFIFGIIFHSAVGLNIIGLNLNEIDVDEFTKILPREEL